MAQGNKKPDLSDLKARLGLKKPGAADKDEQSQDAAPQEQGASPQQAPADGPGPASGRPGQSGPPPGAAPPQASGPPPGARKPQGGQGAPGGGAPSPAQRQGPTQNQGAGQARGPGSASPSPSATSSQSADPTSTARSDHGASGAAADVELDDEDMKVVGGSIFSAPVLVLMVVLLGVGIVFGWMVANTMTNRQVYNARSDDAARVHEALEPKLAEVEKANGILKKMSPDEPDYKALDKLAGLEFELEGNVLSSNRLLLGPEIIDYVTSFAADAALLQELVAEHKRLTELEKEELEALVADNEILKKDRFAVLFDYDYLAKRSGGDDYMPKPGKLVTVPEEMEKDEEGQIEVEMLGSDRTIKTKVQGILPLHKADILKTGGDNALQRYKSRLVRINRQLGKFDEYSDRMMGRLKDLADKEEAPLINL